MFLLGGVILLVVVMILLLKYRQKISLGLITDLIIALLLILTLFGALLLFVSS